MLDRGRMVEATNLPCEQPPPLPISPEVHRLDVEVVLPVQETDQDRRGNEVVDQEPGYWRIGEA